jgi:hypothetical protein
VRSAVRARLLLAAVCLVAGLAGGSAQAHTRSQSYSTWRIDPEGDVRVSFNVSAREVTRLAALEPGGGAQSLGLEALMANHLSRALGVRAAGEECSALDSPRALSARPGHVRIEWQFRCAPGADLEIHSAAFFDIAPSHVHFARVFVGEAPSIEYLFTDASRTRSVALAQRGTVAEERPATATFSSYLVLGVEHILAGLDHIAFLLALLLLSRRTREVVFLVTGFTLGHSVTLSLAALGVVEPDAAVIETLIGFTIALVAVEATSVATGASAQLSAVAGVGLGGLALLSLWIGVGPPPIVRAGRARFSTGDLRLARTRELAIRLSPALTTIFGLVHGFGFASVLMEVGLPSERLIPALFGFNVGVELGQLAVVGLVWGAGTLIVPRVSASGLRLGADAASAVLCGLGLFWFVDRAFGG